MYISARCIAVYIKQEESPLNFKELVDNCSLRKYNHPQVPEKKEHFTFNEGNYLQILLPPYNLYALSMNIITVHSNQI